MKNNIAVITGASRGIGKQIALTLAKQGVHVALIGRTQSDLEKVKEAAQLFGVRSEIFTIDIANDEAVKNAVSQVVSMFGKIDFLINNAGVGSFSNLEDFSEEEWDRIMNTNIKGAFLMTKHIVPLMKKQKSGHVLTIASDVSKRTFAEGSVYCASKYAQDALMSSLRKEVRSFKVKVSLVYPGLVDTYFGESAQGEPQKSNWLKTQDIADAVLYILNTPSNVVIDELTIHPIEQEY